MTGLRFQHGRRCPRPAWHSSPKGRRAGGVLWQRRGVRPLDDSLSSPRCGANSLGLLLSATSYVGARVIGGGDALGRARPRRVPPCCHGRIGPSWRGRRWREVRPLASSSFLPRGGADSLAIAWPRSSPASPHAAEGTPHAVEGTCCGGKYALHRVPSMAPACPPWAPRTGRACPGVEGTPLRVRAKCPPWRLLPWREDGVSPRTWRGRRL